MSMDRSEGPWADESDEPGDESDEPGDESDEPGNGSRPDGHGEDRGQNLAQSEGARLPARDSPGWGRLGRCPPDRQTDEVPRLKIGHAVVHRRSRHEEVVMRKSS